jgi:P4 family phage/plasmid primase-like protien
MPEIKSRADRHHPRPKTAESDGTSVLHEALRLRKCGLAVVPCVGKKPCIGKGWQTKRLSAAELRHHLSRPGVGIGIVLNLTPFIDVECDTPEAEAAFKRMCGGKIPRTPTWQSTRGKHRLFIRPPGMPDKGTVKLDGVEFHGLSKTRGRQSVAPPSVADGFQRRWLPGRSIHDLEPAELPPEVVKRLREPLRKPPAPRPGRATGDGDEFPEGTRNDDLFKLACNSYRTGLSEEAVREAIHGENTSRCRAPLPPAEVDLLLKSAREQVKQGGPAGPGGDFQPLKAARGRTDVNNAARFTSRHRANVHWIGPWDKWVVWDGKRWHIDDSRTIDRKAKAIAADLWEEFTRVGKGCADAKEVLRFLHYSSAAYGIQAMLSLARSEMAFPHHALDKCPWLLNVANGTIDLRTGKLRGHRRKDFITKLAPVTFDPDADCPRWRAFLDTIFAGNEELIGYVQRLAGYCLTGVTEEHILPFLNGTGANGKTTLVEALLKLLGPDYAMKAAPDLLMARRGESHPTDRADLWGKRFVACVETEEGRRMAEALTKELTGGDKIRARRMREDFWEFTPTHHVWLAGNHKPAITGTDHGIWRRIKLIPFDVVIPDADQDKRLPAKLARELPGILNWAIAGCLAWRRDGMQEPAIVRAATEGYAEEQDEVQQFLDDFCEQGADFMTSAGALYRAFQEAMPGSRVSQHSFGARLRLKGFANKDPDGKDYRVTTKGDDHGKHAWRGLRLKTDAVRERNEAQARALAERIRARAAERKARRTAGER